MRGRTGDASMGVERGEQGGTEMQEWSWRRGRRVSAEGGASRLKISRLGRARGSDKGMTAGGSRRAGGGGGPER